MKCASTHKHRFESIPANRRGEAGFTLLEVLIAFALLLFITLFTYQKIGSTYRLRDRLLTQGDFASSISLAIGIIDRDISMMYSPVMMIPDEAPPPNQGGNPQGGNPQGGAPGPGGNTHVSAALQAAIAWGDERRGSEYWAGVVDVSGIRAMRFQGEETSISFVSASHVRTYKEARESVFAKVAYELRDDSFADEDLQGTKVMVKIVDPNAFEIETDETEQSRVYRLLPGVRNLKLQYYDKDRDRWVNRWDSDHSEFKHKYPDLVKMEIELAGEGELVHDGIYFFRPEVPIHGFFPTL